MGKKTAQLDTNYRDENHQKVETPEERFRNTYMRGKGSKQRKKEEVEERNERIKRRKS